VSQLWDYHVNEIGEKIRWRLWAAFFATQVRSVRIISAADIKD